MIYFGAVSYVSLNTFENIFQCVWFFTMKTYNRRFTNTRSHTHTHTYAFGGLIDLHAKKKNLTNTAHTLKKIKQINTITSLWKTGNYLFVMSKYAHAVLKFLTISKFKSVPLTITNNLGCTLKNTITFHTALFSRWYISSSDAKHFGTSVQDDFINILAPNAARRNEWLNVIECNTWHQNMRLHFFCV